MIRRIHMVGLALGFVALVVSAGCKKASPLVGTWRAKNDVMFQGYNSQAYLTYKFNENGTFVQQNFIKTPTGAFSTDFGGTYTFKEGSLEITMTKILQVKGGTAGFSDKMRKEAERSLNVPTPSTIKFQGDKKLTMTADSKTFTFDKVE